MSKWRPRKEGCLFVIPDIHGEINSLQLILNRITPLRKKDKIIFLGDYIDRNINSSKVLDLLISLKDEYKDQIILLMGNHELMVLDALDSMIPNKYMYDLWIKNGGEETLYGYAERAGLTKDNSFSFYASFKNIQWAKNIVPKEHLDFMFNNLLPCYQQDDFIFVHGGCIPDKDPNQIKIDTLCWDRSLLKLAIKYIKLGMVPPWEKTIITGHNTMPKPIVTDNFMMLDIGAYEGLLVVEVFTRQAFLAKKDKNRMVKYDIKNLDSQDPVLSLNLY